MFEMQVQIPDQHGSLVWVSVCRSNSDQPYRYETREEAQRMLDICYPRVELTRHNRQARVIEVAA